MKVAIVGGGASAAYSILACKELDIVPDVFVLGDKIPVQAGAYWLKWIPKNIEHLFAKYTVEVSSVGSREHYILKQWNKLIPGYQSSFPDTPFIEKAYEPTEVLETVFKSVWLNRISISKPLDDRDLLYLLNDYDMVFHTFPTEKAKEKNSDLIVKFPVGISDTELKANTVVYVGIEGSPVVRTSVLFGKRYMEYIPTSVSAPNRPGMRMSTAVDLRPFERPVDMFQLHPKIIPVGRLARFDRKCLSHDGFDLVQGSIEYARS